MRRPNSGDDILYRRHTTSASEVAFQESTAPNDTLAELMRGAILLTNDVVVTGNLTLPEVVSPLRDVDTGTPA